MREVISVHVGQAGVQMGKFKHQVVSKLGYVWDWDEFRIIFVWKYLYSADRIDSPGS